MAAGRRLVVLIALLDAVAGSVASGAFAAAGPQAPSQLRLSLGDCAGELVVMWSTAAATNASCAQLLPKGVGSWSRPGLSVPAALADALGAAATSGVARHSVPLAAGAKDGAVSQRRLAEQPPAPDNEQGHFGDVRTVCGASAPFLEPSTNATSQFLHKVVLAPLDAGRQYLYRVGCEQGGWSRWATLRAPRAPHQVTEQHPASLLVVGDLGFANSETLPDLVREAEGGQFDALLHVGDLAYDLQALQGRRASQFLRKLEPIASRLPYVVLPGNHEFHFNFTHFRELFAMPNRAMGENMFYSFDLGPLHVLAYNTEVFLWPESFGIESMRMMYEWMEQDLKAANLNRAQIPWILVAGHRPMYCAMARGATCDWGWFREHEASRLGIPSRCSPHQPLYCPPTHAEGDVRFPIEELFHKYGVDIAVFGHSHDYERYYPVYNLTVAQSGHSGWGSILGEEAMYLNPQATVHITSGAGGNPEMRRGADAPPSGPCNRTAPWCAFQSGYAPQGQQSSDYSFSKVRAFNATHLLWEQYSSTLGRLVDSWWLVQHRHGPFLEVLRGEGSPLPAAASERRGSGTA